MADAAAASRAWLTAELTSALGFAEVDDIAAYVCSAFSSKQDVVPYLTELLGITPSRAEAIGARLFQAPPAPQKSSKQRGNNNSSSTASLASAPNGGLPAALVPPAAVPNSRLRQAKQKKTGAPKLMHARVINCLQCGRIEHNGGRACAFCGAELRYEELDEHELDSTARRHMETLVLYDETSAERTAVVNADEQMYEEVALGAEERRRAVTLDLDLARRQFILSDDAIRRNQELSKDARELCDGIQRRFERAGGSGGRQQQQQQQQHQQQQRLSAAPASVDDAELLYV